MPSSGRAWARRPSELSALRVSVLWARAGFGRAPRPPSWRRRRRPRPSSGPRVAQGSQPPTRAR
eukprot:9232238-Alexandrium_andersonii.AAC.1